MITGDAVDRMLTLTSISPFDVLKESELLLVAQHLHPRSYSAGELILAGGHVAEMVIVAASGTALCRGVSDQRALPAIVGAPSILFSLPIDESVFAGPDGVDALCLAKPHLFTIARECPDFIVGLTDLYRAAAL
jgi:hypothetical protein